MIRAYWVLYLARSNFVQEQQGAGAVNALAKRLAGREGVDALPLQISRARAVSATRAAGLVRAENERPPVPRRQSHTESGQTVRHTGYNTQKAWQGFPDGWLGVSV